MALQPAVRWLAEGKPLDPRLAPLLAEIARTGSLSKAVAALRVSYRNAWGLLGKTGRTLGQPLVVLEKGRGATLTPFGSNLLRADRAAAELLARGLADTVKTLNQKPGRSTGRSRAQALVVHASHDFALAGLRDRLAAAGGPGLDLHFQGSLDSLSDLAQGRCDVAGFHLPADPDDDSAYDAYRPLLRARSLILVRFVTRRQGLMVAAGNPRKIRTLADLGGNGIRFVNRQRGSGTRTYFDYLLAVQGISPAQIAGYEVEEFTHAAIAATIASGMADAGFGIEAAARKQHLDFIPLATERYFLAARQGRFSTAAAHALLAALRSPEFRDSCRNLPGYDATGSGDIVSAAGFLTAIGAAGRPER